jgi:hypothetical protein
MKKLLRKAFNRQTTAPPETGGRITNETVAEHRERVLAGARKFKYPLQYTKHRLWIISIVIVVVTTFSFFGFCAWQLYSVQTTDKLMYRLTQLVPLPIAKVDGEWVRYSDYLLELRSAIHYLSTKEAVNFNSDDGRRQLDYQKRLAMDKAIENTVVARLAREQAISITDQEVNDFVKGQISSDRLGVSEDVYRQVIRDYYDWSFDEYKNSIRQQLLRKKVMAKLDQESRTKAEAILKKINGGGDFAAIAKKESEDILSKDQGGDVGLVNKDTDDPNGLIVAAAALKPNQVSKVIEGVDGLYVLKLLEHREGGDLHFAKIYVSYKILEKKMEELRDKKLLEEYVTVGQVAGPDKQ